MLSRKTPPSRGNYLPYLISSLTGGLTAWFFSGSVTLGIWVFIAVWFGNWIGYSLRKNS